MVSFFLSAPICLSGARAALQHDRRHPVVDRARLPRLRAELRRLRCLVRGRDRGAFESVSSALHGAAPALAVGVLSVGLYAPEQH